MGGIKRSNSFVNILLASIIVAGVIGITLTAPNIFVALRPFLKKKQNRKKISADDIKKLLKKLEFSKLVEIKEDGDKITMLLTEKGQKRVLKYNFDKMEIDNKGKWDGKWRLIISDIPEKHKAARDALRRKLLGLRFMQLQKSVWLCPFECKNEIDFLRSFFNVGQYIHYLIVVRIENEGFYKKYFDI